MTNASDSARTPAAAAHVAAIAERQGKPAILRLSVEGGGCSGFQYRFGLAELIDDDDIRVDTDGATLVVDAISLDLVRGCSVDFVDSLGRTAFRVENPNAASRSEEHTSALQSLMRISSAVFSLTQQTTPTSQLTSSTQ